MGISAILLTAGRLEGKKRSFFWIEPPMEGSRPFFNRGGQGCRIISDKNSGLINQTLQIIGRHHPGGHITVLMLTPNFAAIS
jgi:hypothetical protein